MKSTAIARPMRAFAAAASMPTIRPHAGPTPKGANQIPPMTNRATAAARTPSQLTSNPCILPSPHVMMGGYHGGPRGGQERDPRTAGDLLLPPGQLSLPGNGGAVHRRWDLG